MPADTAATRPSQRKKTWGEWLVTLLFALALYGLIEAVASREQRNARTALAGECTVSGEYPLDGNATGYLVECPPGSRLDLPPTPAGSPER